LDKKIYLNLLKNYKKRVRNYGDAGEKGIEDL